MAKLPRLLPLIAVAIGGVVAVRAVGAGPDLFQGAVAWAEEAAETAGEAVAPEILFGQVAALDHHAPGPVEQEDTVPGGGVEGRDAVGAGHAGTVLVSRTPSTRQIA